MEATQTCMQDSLNGVSDRVHQVNATVQEMLTNIDKRFGDLTRMMESMGKVKDTMVCQGPGGQRATGSRPFAKQGDTGTPQGQRRARPADEEGGRTRFLQFPMGVHHAQAKCEMQDARLAIGQGGALRFGMWFWDGLRG